MGQRDALGVLVVVIISFSVLYVGVVLVAETFTSCDGPPGFEMGKGSEAGEAWHGWRDCGRDRRGADVSGGDLQSHVRTGLSYGVR